MRRIRYALVPKMAKTDADGNRAESVELRRARRDPRGSPGHYDSIPSVRIVKRNI